MTLPNVPDRRRQIETVAFSCHVIRSQTQDGGRRSNLWI
jgi:hypothetical protein